MKKKIIISIIFIIAVSTTLEVFASAATTAATTAAITAAATAARHNRNNRDNTIDTNKEVSDYIFEKTQNEKIKEYINENQEYLYLNTEDKANEVINKYNESDTEQTIQFIKEEYYDENKPKIEMLLLLASFGTIIIFLIIIGIVMKI